MVNKLITFWWRAIPLAAAKISKLGAIVAADGLYLTSFKAFSAFTPLVALGLGAIAGWAGFGAQTVFSESLTVVLIALLCGCISTLHGGLFVLGFGMVSSFTTESLAWSGDAGSQVLFQLGLIITYAAMGLLAVGVPFLARALRNTIDFKFIPNADLRLLSQLILGAVIYGGLVFLFLQVLPLLIRPPFTWLGTVPTVAAAYQAQALTTIIVVVAAIGGFIRVITEGVTAASDPIGQSIALEPVQKALENKGWLDRLPLPVQMVISTLISTALFAGLFMSWFDVVVMAGGFITINLARRPLAKAFPIWPEILSKVPFLLRLIVAFGIIYFLTSTYIGQFYNGTSFISIIGGSLVGMIIMALFMPPLPKKPEETPKKEDEYEEIL